MTQSKHADAEAIGVLREALSELADCVDDGCYCSEMKMATAVDEARAAMKGSDT